MSRWVRAAALAAGFFVVSACSSASPEAFDDDGDDSESELSSGYKPACSAQPGPTFALHGVALLPEGPQESWVVVSGDKIAQVAAHADELAPGTPILETGGVIAPGLVDLHNHVAYDFIPFWDSGKLWSNRYQWARSSAYASAVKAPYNAVKKAGFTCEAVKYGELRAIVGGTTSIQGSVDLACTRSWARNVEYSNFCKDEIRQNVLPIGDMKQADADALRAQFASGKTKAFFVHLAEGVDDASRAELDRLEQLGLLQPQVVGIHATALDAPRLAKMGQAGMKIVWSPRSNLALYGTTTDIPTALAAGVTVSLAPDWSPSGSANVLAELKVADRVNHDRFGSLLTDRQLVDMVTINPARTLAMDDKLGAIRPGLYADLIVVRGDASAPYRALIDAQPADVLLTTVGGQAFYGTSDLVTAIGDGRPYAAVDACGEPRLVADAEPFLPIPGATERLPDITAKLASAAGRPPIPLFTCDSTPKAQ